MVDTPHGEPPLNRPETAAQVAPEDLRTATRAMAVGSMLEYYDFALYGLASAIIFSELFPPWAVQRGSSRYSASTPWASWLARSEA